MTHITIKDLPQSEELDRQAMRSIAGGGSAEPPRSRVRAATAVSATSAGSADPAGPVASAPACRVVEFPRGFDQWGRILRKPADTTK